MNTLSRRQRPPYRSERHVALDEFEPADWPTTARFKRSVREAFLCDATEAAAIEKPLRVPLGVRVFYVLCVVAVVAVAVAAIFYSRATP